MRVLVLSLVLLSSLYGQFVPGQYIVELKDDTVMTRRTRQARVESALTARGYKTRARTERVANALVVEAPDDNSDPRSLMGQMSDVVKIYKVRIYKKSLDKAASVHAVTTAWERLGLDKAGAGMKVGIIDSGIQSNHPGFAADALPALDGFPKVSAEENRPYTNNKIIVARSYADLFARNDPTTSVLDRSGHGTAVAMSAAGVRHDSPLGPLSGMAPAAYIGVYKVFGTPNINDGATDAAILKAIDDAVADGMDVINLSFGSIFAARPENDILVQALKRAEDAGVIAVVAAGNDGPGKATLGSPASAPTALTVGANENGHLFASAILSGDQFLSIAATGSRTATSGTLSGNLQSIKSLDSSEQGCSALPTGSLTGKIALIQRGICAFESKIIYAGRAGAIGVVVYGDAARATELVSMDAGTATLPAVFVKYADGVNLRDNYQDSQIVLDFAIKGRDQDPNRIASFSSRGPISGVNIKPDLLAAGTNIYTAAQNNYAVGDVYSTNGYIAINGTSFSSPIVAGITAVLKAARPGLRPAEYRSLLINSSRTLSIDGTNVNTTGAGLVDLSRALDLPLRAIPATVTFNNDEQNVELKNLGGTASYLVSVEPREGRAPAVSTTQLDLEAGATATLKLALNRASLDPGSYSGVVVVQADGQPTMRIPYYFGKTNEAAAAEIQVLDYPTTTVRSNVVYRDLFFFRVLDANGMALTSKPTVNVISGNARVREVQDRDFDLAGSFGLDIVFGAGVNVIEVDGGNGITQRFTVLAR
jgi:minor extracellular serine protease Vpr